MSRPTQKCHVCQPFTHHGVGGLVKYNKIIFARNSMKCLDLQRKMMFAIG